MRHATFTATTRHFDLRLSRLSHVACHLSLCAISGALLAGCAGEAPAIHENFANQTEFSALAGVRERISAVFAGMEGDFHRERLEMRLEAAERLAAVPDRTPLEDAELAEFRAYFREAFDLWERDPLNPASRPVELNLADFMADVATTPSSSFTSHDGEGAVATADSAFSRAVAAVRALNGAPSILRVPAGDYFISEAKPSVAEEGGIFHLDFSALTNCAIVGESPETTRIEFGTHGENGVTIALSRNCTISGLDLSWREAPFAQVAIESYDPTNFTAVVRHHPGTMRPDDPRFLDNPGRTEQVCMLYTAEGRYLRGRGGCPYPFFKLGSAVDLGGGRFRIGFDARRSNIRAYRPLPGDVLCIPDRDNRRQGFRIQDSSFCNLHRVWFRNSIAGTVAGKRCRYITADHCRTFPKSPDLFLSSNADTFFVARGAHLAHCTFEHMGDDGANCLGEGFLILRRDGRRTITLQRFLGRLRAGDVVRIVHAIDGRTLCEPRVAEVTAGDAPTITFEEDLPDELVTIADAGAVDKAKHYDVVHGLANLEKAPDILFAPISFGTGFTMKDCVIRGNRGCGLNVQCPHAIVEDNVFDNILVGMKMTGLTQYPEGPAPCNVVLRRNVFRDCGMAVCSRATTANRSLALDDPIRWIEISSNRFERCKTVFDLKNASDVTMKDNETNAPAAGERGGRPRTLADGFDNPPQDRYPEIWLFKFGSETPDETIAYDLERLRAAGVAGVTVYGFDATDEKPYGTLALDGRPKAVERFRHLLREAGRLGMDVRLCIGPAGCGNERVSPDNAQKSLILSSADADGGVALRLSLPKGEIGMPARCVWPPAKTDFAWARAHWHDIRVLAAPLKDGGATPEEILDVTAFFDQATETLSWDAPPGRWRFVRAGWVPMKLGWVDYYIDPLSRAAFDEHWAHTVQPILDAATPDERKAFKGVMVDSWEAGEVGWTQNFPEEFRRRRGYDVWPAIAAKAGVALAVEGGAEKALRDFGETLSDLFSDNYYGYMKEVANRHGLEAEAEACGPHQSMGDMRRMQSRCDLATGEFWMPCPHRFRPQQRFMLRDVATSVHIYGLSDVRAESFTTMGTHWEESPAMMKPCADRAFCDGLTRIVYHGMLVSDPLWQFPGATRRAGAYYSPKVTWFPQSAPLNRYFARCSWMLSQGRFAADCLLYAGDALGLFIGLKTTEDALGPGHDYDLCPTEALLTARVEKGEIVLPSGMRYKALYLSDKNPKSVCTRARYWQEPDTTPCEWPIPAEARAKIDALKAAGATVLETRAERDAFVASGVLAPDFEAEGVPQGAIDWIHRTEVPDGDSTADIYFVSNQSGETANFAALFRQEPKRAELWDAVTGERRPAQFETTGQGRVRLRLHLAPCGSVFAVFQDADGKSEATTPPPSRGGSDAEGAVVTSAGGPPAPPEAVSILPQPAGWTVSFDPRWGGPAEPQTDLDPGTPAADWTRSSDPRIRYYSGTAVYRLRFDLPAAAKARDVASSAAALDLGTVRDVAEVRLNGRDLGILWTPPFAAPIPAGVLKPMDNELEVRVTNLWKNRLVGDASLPPEERVAQTPKNPFGPDAPLLPSGLIGPVTISPVSPTTPTTR